MLIAFRVRSRAEAKPWKSAKQPSEPMSGASDRLYETASIRMLPNSMAPADTQPKNFLSVDIKLLRIISERMARITLKKSSAIGQTSVKRLWDAAGQKPVLRIRLSILQTDLKKTVTFLPQPRLPSYEIESSSYLE